MQEPTASNVGRRGGVEARRSVARGELESLLAARVA